MAWVVKILLGIVSARVGRSIRGSVVPYTMVNKVGIPFEIVGLVEDQTHGSHAARYHRDPGSTPR